MIPSKWTGKRLISTPKKKLEGLPSSWEWVSPSLTTPALPTCTMGVHRVGPTHTPCIVISDSWPRWLTMLPSYAFTCCHLLVNDPAAPWITPLLSHHVDCQVSPLSTYTALPSTPFAFGQCSLRVAELMAVPFLFPLGYFVGVSLIPLGSSLFRLTHPDSSCIMWIMGGGYSVAHENSWGLWPFPHPHAPR